MIHNKNLAHLRSNAEDVTCVDVQDLTKHGRGHKVLAFYNDGRIITIAEYLTKNEADGYHKICHRAVEEARKRMKKNE